MSFYRSLFITSLFLTGIFLALPGQAAPLQAGDLIKTQNQPDVYYYGANGKRYVFPNEKTFMSWYGDLDTPSSVMLLIKEISPQELASIGIGGAVTYRPGKRMVKITTDPKVYAVAKGGVLRWVESEQVASQLYGSDWAKKIDDLPDEFFATYKIGSSIKNSSDYSPLTELDATPTIAADKNLSNSLSIPSPLPLPSPSSTVPISTPAAISLSVSKPSPLPGDIELLTASATHPSGIQKIDLFFDGMLIKTCFSSSICAGETPIPLSGTKTNYEAKAIATALNATQLITTSTLMVKDIAAGLVKLRLGRAMIKPGQIAEAVLTTDLSIDIKQANIYIDGQSVKGCTASSLNPHECKWIDILPGSIGKTYDFQGVVTDSLGRTYTTPHQILTIGTNDSPVLSIIMEKNTIFVGETVGITANASDDDGIGSIELLQGGTVLKTCSGTFSCNLSSGPWTNAETLTFSARVTDIPGAMATSSEEYVTVQ